MRVRAYFGMAPIAGLALGAMTLAGFYAQSLWRAGDGRAPKSTALQDKIAGPFQQQVLQEAASRHLREYEAARNSNRPAVAVDELDRARNVIEKMIARTPTDGNLWELLAEIETRRGGFDSAAKSFLEMSYRMSRLELYVMLNRIRFGLQYWVKLDEQSRKMIERDMQNLLGMRQKKDALRMLADATAHAGPEGKDAARASVALNIPEKLLDYDRLFRP